MSDPEPTPMTDTPDTPPRSPDGSQVGGSALPGGVMMRTRNRVGIAVRHEDSGEILTEGFDLSPRTGSWARWPLVRGVMAMQTALSVGRRSLTISEDLRWSEEVAEGEDTADDDAIGPLGKVLIVLSAIFGAGIQVAAFRIGPIVIAKEIGLTGAAFIVADAALRLALLLGTLWVLSKFRPFRRILSYHGAEHKAIAAHEGGAPLTAAAAAGFTRFHPRCGTSFLVVSALVSIAVYGAVLAITGVFTYPALIATRLLGGPIVTAIAFELQRQAARHADGPWGFLAWPGTAAQHLTTAEPGPQELEVACAALQVALEPAAETEAVEAVAPNALRTPEPGPQPLV